MYVLLLPLSVCRSVCVSVYLSACLSVCLFIRPFVYLSVGLFVCLPVCLFIYLSISPPCISVCLEVHVRLSYITNLHTCLQMYFRTYIVQQSSRTSLESRCGLWMCFRQPFAFSKNTCCGHVTTECTIFMSEM